MMHFPTPIFFAHRGASAYAPENTLAAFELAARQGAPAIEFDVKLTSDRKVVIIHDLSLDRTTNGSGPVARQSLAALRELDAGSWMSEEFRGEKIPLLEEVFEAVGNKLLINIELTNYGTPFDGLVGEVAALVRKHGLQEKIIFSSFSPPNLAAAQRLLPDVPRGQLIPEGRQGWMQRLAARFMSLDAEHPFTSDVDAGLVQRLHGRGRRIHAWTVNDPAEMRRLYAIGVDGIFSDDPLLAIKNFK
ncbi:MAG TPA: glycerophosphodiester phosphodiesterase family protein [Anaerolineales bacterium]|jgi:glycerophosphoryl diester phosphodiesterase